MADAVSDKSLLTRVLGRSSSLFQNDVEGAQTHLNEAIGGASVLIIGAAGSIGSAFVKQLAAYAPAKLHLIDLSENNLVEVVRSLRSSSVALPADFASYAIVLGSPEFDAFLSAQKPYDYVMNFSALKHVRSERDPYTLMRLLHTNVLALADLTRNLDAKTRLFSVSSDKAVNPANLMGSSKALMERVLWGGPQKSSSARFANVAFSDGSLLHSFEQRLAKGQPLAAPTDVRRYFISEQEAGQLCLLACLGAEREVFVPKLSPETDLYSFADIAQIVLAAHSLTPVIFENEDEAKAAADELSQTSNQWPCCFSASDTSGEKAFEEFYSEGDAVDHERFEQVAVVQETFSEQEKQSLETVLESLKEVRSKGSWSKTDLVKLVKDAVPTLKHQETFKNLDQKM